MLSAKAICKTYRAPGGNLAVLNNLSLQLDPGESLAVMGPSGSGKSTLLNILGALESPSSGSVKLGEIEPFALGEAEVAKFRNRHVGFVFQEHHLLPQCTVLENVLLPSLAFDSGDQSQRAQALAEKVGLAERLHHRPSELSGGERQRVAIARALINRPGLILADEPTGNLDADNAQRIVELLVNVHSQTASVLIVVTHSAGVADQFQKTATLVSGQLTFT